MPSLGIEAQEIVIESHARLGELTRAMPKVPAGKRRGSEFHEGTQKKERLKAERISRKQAADAEAIASLVKLPSGT